ncbi:heterokaryon incompatibility protein-domain-containing protein [Triangularia verruculosa]|uniref:Heterokaryon incompatibility protein-domain-containing protein n=1 Tax=Triangularia verruculosa TaxID=2587418 RepID=A0AAN7AS51_9PEZI|nr:heterokaryon incompatibility protein-domain-containing protein [Triangularia verruculosa]
MRPNPRVRRRSLGNPNLCERCRGWDGLWHWPHERQDYVSLEELSQNSHCIMCQAIAIVGDTRRRESESLQLFPPSQILIRNDGPYFLDRGPGSGSREPYLEAQHRIHSSDATTLAINILIYLQFAVQSGNLEPLRGISQADSHFAISPQFRVHYSKGERPRILGIKPWEARFFDVSLLKTWIKGCETVHGSSCSRDDKSVVELPSDFRLIDIQSMAIVKPLKPVRFAALSYMWQQNEGIRYTQLESWTLKALETPNGIDDITLPTLISDAICLCRDLGERYLWVDQLCIVQDDPRSKHTQVQSMDKIYRSASFTIIAALNKRDGEGLPGYRSKPRRSSLWSPPRDCDVEGRNIRPKGMEILADSSLWNKRGWTFQERVLSRRRLFITEFQTIFECSRGTASEELTYYPQRPFSSYQPHEAGADEEEYKHIPGFQNSANEGRSRVTYNLTEATSLVDYFHWVENYTTRQLSFGSDILNAFAGVGKALGEVLQSPFLFGLVERYLPQTLMWSCYGLAQRRAEMQGTPSWSWASSANQANYSWISGGSRLDKDLLEIASLVFFHFQDPDVGLRKLDVEERWIDHAIAIKDIEIMSGVPELKPRKYVPATWRSTQTWRECPHNPWQTMAHLTLDPEARDVCAEMPGSLIFNTTVASLKLERDSRDIYEGKDFVERDVAIRRYDGELVGWINKMSPDWIDASLSGEETFDFVVICGALANWRARKTRVQYFEDFDLWRLHVMLIERLPLKRHLARRVDVGYVFAHKWKDCNPRWETIVLC